MALQKNIQAATGLEVPNAYIKVVEYNCFGDMVQARLRAYVSKQAALDGKLHIEGSEDVLNLTADYTDEAPNTKKQLYNHAKTLEKYSDAVDIFE